MKRWLALMLFAACSGEKIEVQVGGPAASAVKFSDWKYDGATCVSKMTYNGSSEIEGIDAVLYDKDATKTAETSVHFPSASKGETVRVFIGACSAAKIVLTVR